MSTCEYCNRRSTRHYHGVELCEMHYLFENTVRRTDRVNIHWDKINRYRNIPEKDEKTLKKFNAYEKH